MGPFRKAALLFGTTPENLLWNHTLFPYVTAFATEDRCERALQSMSEHFKGRRQAGISGLTRVGRLRVCKQCLDEDLVGSGESYWHRSHNLPGAFYCVKHHCLLNPTSFEAEWRTSSVLPADCKLLEAPSAWVSPGSLELALASVALLSRTPGAGDPRSADFYLRLAVERELLSANCEVSGPALKELFLTCFHSDFLAAASVELSPTCNWPSRAFMPRSRSFSPLRQLMVETALRHGTPKPSLLNHKRKGNRGPSRQELDERFSAAGIAELNKLIATSQPLMLAPFLKRIGAVAAWKTTSRSKHPKLIAVVKRLRAWNSGCAKLAHDHNWQEVDHKLAAAAGVELERLMAIGQKAALREFLKRIGALEAWRDHNVDVPKLRVVAKNLQTWNDSLLTSSLRLKFRVADEKFSLVASAELQKAIDAGERLTLGALMNRIGAVKMWGRYKTECPKLAVVVERARSWEKATRKF
jgi:hypothetical protein